MEFPGRVLIIDDNAMSRRKLAMAVRKLGHEWAEASGGEAGLALLKTQDFDLLLLDIMMPDLDGFGVLERLRADRSFGFVPVLVISGLDDDMASVARAIQLGATDFLPKDFDVVLFRARVEACIERKRLRVAELDYLAQVDRIAAAAELMEERSFHPKNLGLEPVALRSDSIGRLARVFGEMAQQVYDRERAMARSIRTAKGVVLLLLAGILGGLMSPIAVILFKAIPMATGLSLWGDLLSGIICLGIAAAMGRLSRISRETLAFLTLWAVLNVGAGVLIFEVAGRVSGIALSIILALQSIIVFMIAAILRMEDASLRRVFGLALGLAGVATLIAARETIGGSYSWIWLIIAMLIPISWAVTDILIAAKGSKTELDPIAGLGVMYFLSAFLTLPLAFAQGQLFMIGPGSGWTFWLILFNAVNDAANYLVYVWLVAIAGAVFASQSSYVTTIAGIFWSMLLLGENLSGGALTALALILVGMLVVGTKREAEDPEVQFVSRSRRTGRRSFLKWN